MNEAHLSRTRPVLDRLFTLANIVVQFKVDELLQAMAPREARRQAVAVFMAPADEIAGHADVRCQCGFPLEACGNDELGGRA